MEGRDSPMTTNKTGIGTKIQWENTTITIITIKQKELAEYIKAAARSSDYGGCDGTHARSIPVPGLPRPTR